MASLDLASSNFNGRVYLRNHHTFGRHNDSADTSIDYSLASKLHITIEWQAPNWLLRDTSKNGVKLNNAFIPTQEAVALDVGDIIDLAGRGDLLLTVVDLDEPIPMLVSSSSTVKPIELVTHHLLLNNETPEVALWLCPDRRQWFSDKLSTGLESGPYVHDDAVHLASSSWSFLLPKNVDESNSARPQTTDLDDVTFHFDIASTEQSINLTIIESGLEIDLGEQEHYSLFIQLLKQTADSGWVSNQQLLETLGIEELELNLQVFELRKQIASILPSAFGHSKLVERRPGALKTNIKNFDIFKDGVKEAQE